MQIGVYVVGAILSMMVWMEGVCVCVCVCVGGGGVWYSLFSKKLAHYSYH